jgi:hypothetical protein
MGAASSRAGGVDIDNPFPLDEGHNSNLDVLSMIAARILNTGDIYKLDNLTNPGECGNYAVFLRDKIEQTLLPFVTEVDMTGKHGPNKTQKEILYQSSSVSIPEVGARKDICTELATTMITVVSIVVASLASIQVKSSSREAQFTNNQKGGSYNAIFQWLQQSGFVTVPPSVNAPFELSTPGDTSAKETRDRIFISLSSTNSLTSTYGTVYARERKSPPDTPFPVGASFNIEIFDPIDLPTATQGLSVLPLRILDSSRDTWLAGVLFQNFFITFVKRTQRPNHIVPLIANLFRRFRDGVAAAKTPFDESKAELHAANQVLTTYISSGFNPGVIAATLNPFFTALGHPFLSSSAGGIIRGQGGIMGIGGQGLGGQGFGGQGLGGQGLGGQGLGGLQGFGGQGLGLQGQGLGGWGGNKGGWGGQGLGGQGLGGQAWAQLQGLPGPGARIGGIPGGTYVIPYVASQRLTTWLSSFKSLLPKESSPAAVRASILAREVTKDRNVAPGICTDDYFKETSLAKVMPWLTLQLLFIDDITKLTAAPSPAIFGPDWPTFISNLAAVYTTANVTPKIQGPAGPVFLDTLSFKGSVTVEGKDCKTLTSKLVVGYKEVKDGLLAIHGAYMRHCNAVFQLISKLVVTLQDGPNQFVRLHPNVVKSDSKAYVNGVRAEARKLISEFYLEIERLYVNTIQNMKVK